MDPIISTEPREWLDGQTYELSFLFQYGDHERAMEAIEAFLEVVRLSGEVAA